MGVYIDLPPRNDLLIPYLKNVAYPLGVFGFVALSYLVIVGSSNAVNLTDGLDGLAIMPTVLIGGALGVFAYVTGDGLRALPAVPYIPGAGELVIICGAIAGAGLAFLWFNAYPAEVFMGDVGALSLGAALGAIAVIIRQEIVLFIMGGVFVVETLSVMIQVAYFKRTRAGASSAWRHCTTTSNCRVERDAGGGQVLDDQHDAGAGRSFHVENPMSAAQNRFKQARAAERSPKARTCAAQNRIKQARAAGRRAVTP